ncbi:MAG: hypothetical protein U9P82_00840, partial [Bacteroidota bacterium]|nr:hypothetical protein [Bacteroidota bacterium]
NNGIDVTAGDVDIADNLNVTTNATITGNTLVEGNFQLDAAGQNVDNIRTDVRTVGADDVSLVTESAIRTAITDGVTADNGLNENPEGNIRLGGNLIEATTITNNGFNLVIDGNTGDVTFDSEGLVTAGNGIDVTSGDVDITENLNITGNLDANGTVNLSSTGLTTTVEGLFQVNEAANFDGNVDANAGLDVTAGILQADDNVILGATNADTLTVNATADFKDVLNVDGAVTANNGIDVTAGDVDIADNLNVTTNATITGNTLVEGNFQLDAAGQAVDNISIETDLDNGTGAANNVISTQLAVKTYVDNSIDNNDDLAEGNIWVGDATGNQAAVAAFTDGNMLIGDGITLNSVDISGDIDIANNGVAAISDGVIMDADINANAAIDATKIADGTVTNTEFQYINSLTSNAQTQINDINTDIGDLNTLTDGAIYLGDGTNTAQEVTLSGDVTMDNGGVTAIEPGVILDADINASAGINAAKLSNGVVDNTEFDYLNGVTSAIQTQLDTKVDENANIVAGTHTKITYDAKGLVTAGTNATAADILNVAAGDIAATDVQAAINELDTEKEPLLVNSAGLAAALSDETGTGAAVFATSPTLTTPDIGEATGTSLQLTGDITTKHIVGVSGTPTVTWGSGASGTPTATSIEGKDIGGSISFTTGGTTPAAGSMIAKITFDKAYGSAPSSVILTPGTSQSASDFCRVYITNITATYFEIWSTSSNTIETGTHKFYFMVVE